MHRDVTRRSGHIPRSKPPRPPRPPTLESSPISHPFKPIRSLHLQDDAAQYDARADQDADIKEAH